MMMMMMIQVLLISDEWFNVTVDVIQMNDGEEGGCDVSDNVDVGDK